MLAALLLSPVLLFSAQDAEPVDAARTSDEVAAFLGEAEAALYSPEAEGLESYSFDMPMADPMMGSLGTLRVAWTKGQPVSTSVELGEALRAQIAASVPPEQQELMLGQMEAQFLSQGEQIVRTLLNRPFSPLIEEAVVTLEGLEDGLIKVKAVPQAASAAAPTEQVLLFDDENRLVRSRMSAPGMPGEAKISHEWRTASESDELLVMASTSVEVEIPMMGAMKTTTDYRYRTIEGIVLLTGMTQRGMGNTVDQTFENLVVNGTPVAAADSGAGAADADAQDG